MPDPIPPERVERECVRVVVLTDDEHACLVGMVEYAADRSFNAFDSTLDDKFRNAPTFDDAVERGSYGIDATYGPLRITLARAVLDSLREPEGGSDD